MAEIYIDALDKFVPCGKSICQYRGNRARFINTEGVGEWGPVLPISHRSTISCSSAVAFFKHWGHTVVGIFAESRENTVSGDVGPSELEKLQGEHKRLREAAEAVVKKWDSGTEEWSTAKAVNMLRSALEGAPQESTTPKEEVKA